jgi:hypothetical protein
MHPTANSAALIENLPLITLDARRVMPGVRFLSLKPIGDYLGRSLFMSYRQNFLPQK